MNPLHNCLALEEVYFHNKKTKIFLLNFVNFTLMIFVLLVIFAGLGKRSIFGYLINDNDLFHLFLIYLTFNLVSVLIRQKFLFLATYSILIILIFIFLATILFLGIDFHLISLMFLLIVLIGAILVNPRCSFLIYIILSFMFLLIFFLQNNNYFTSDSSWRFNNFNFFDVLLMLLFYFLITMLFYYLIKYFELRLKTTQEKHLMKMIEIIPLLNLGRLTVGLTNEIRNELTIISLVLQNAEMNKRDLDNLDLASEAVDQIEKLSRLAYCKLFSEVEPEVFDLNLEMKYLLHLFKNLSIKTGVTIIFQPNKRYQLHADRLKLDLVLISLILNAIDAYENINGKEKHIFIKFVKKPRNLLIKVKDYGMGIKEQDLPLIFDPYFTSKDGNKCLGLGLYIGQSVMMKAYETKIKVESVINQGSTFTLYIKNKFLLI